MLIDKDRYLEIIEKYNNEIYFKIEEDVKYISVEKEINLIEEIFNDKGIDFNSTSIETELLRNRFRYLDIYKEEINKIRVFNSRKQKIKRVKNI